MKFAEPRLVAIAGDWHANRRWAVSQIPEICRLLDPPRIILHAGDLGVWDEREWSRQHGLPTFLELMQAELEKADATLSFVDGNHEDHEYLKHIAMFSKALGSPYPVHGAERIMWMPRGYRWEWHGKTWLACGGAVSVDKNLRTEGFDWFPEEEITDGQEKRIIADGPADVILSHDAPSCEPLPLGVPQLEWLPMIPKAEAHRERLQRICEAVKPFHLFHGHYHMCRQYTDHPVPWGTCSFTALDMDGVRQGNWGILDTETMQFCWPGELDA